MNSIKAGIYSINPKFKEGSKNYDKTKDLITETLANYEKVLIDLSNFYDVKIDQLILKKVELEADLLGSILDEKYLSYLIEDTEKRKSNDKVKNTVKENFTSALNKLLNRKKENKALDPYTMNKLIDSNDVQEEIGESIIEKFESALNKEIKNKENILNIEKEITRINSEIERLNDCKSKNIYDAMEIGDKEVAIGIRKPRLFSKISRFFIKSLRKFLRKCVHKIKMW